MTLQTTPPNESTESFTTSSLVQTFRDHLCDYCEISGFTFEEITESDHHQLRIYFWENSPMWIRIDIDSQSRSALLVGVARAYDVPHERTDYNDLMSLVWAAEFRRTNHASVRLIDISHPVIAGELVGRYIFFETQPPASYILLEHPDYTTIESIIFHSALAALQFSRLYKASQGDPDLENCTDDDQWARKVAKCLRWKIHHADELVNEREHPHWSFYRRNDHGVTAFRLSINALNLFPSENIEHSETVLNGLESYLIKTETLKNCINKEALLSVSKLLSAYELVMDDLISLRQRNEILFLPTESHLICVTEKGILAIENEGGINVYKDAESKLRIRHQKESSVLYSSVEFNWNNRVDDDRFEMLILDLINREPGVRWARRVGTSRASDGERDLIAEWLLRPAPWESASEQEVLVLRRVVVQCKAYKGSINRSNVGDVVGTVDLHNADGFLLVAFPRITPALLDYITKVPAKRKVWADWWTQPEIEDRLRNNLDIASRYPDLFSVKL